MIGFAITATGGPLALAALYAPQLLGAANPSAGFVALAAAVIFAAPMIIWVLYARREASCGGLYGYVKTAAGQPVALAQAGLWIFSYALYLVYTTEYIVYDVLSHTFSGFQPYRPWFEILIPVAVAGVLLAGRAVMIATVAILAIGQMALVVVLASISLRHDAPASAFGATAPPGAIASASAGIALLYVCGSLPLYLGGEARNATRTLPRALVVGYVATTISITAAIFPIAANPAFLHADVPGVSIARVFEGERAAHAIGVGVAASIAGVIIVEYVALTRLVHAITRRSVEAITRVVAVVLVISGPISLINPDWYYRALIRPSLVALWASQVIAVAVFPLFVRRYRRINALDAGLTGVAVAILGYGLYLTLKHSAGS